MFFDKSTFQNHFAAQHRNGQSGESYARIVTDPSGVRWGYLAYENVYECVNTKRRMTPLMLENYILEQTEIGLNNAGDYSTEAGHGRDNVDRMSLVPRKAFVYGLGYSRFVAQDSGLLYRSRPTISAAADSTSQALIEGCIFQNTTLIPTVGSFSVRHETTTPGRGLNIHSSVDSAEGYTMSAPTGLANNLYAYMGTGSTWENLGRGGTGCEMTVVVGASCDAGLSAGDIIVYKWNAGPTSLLGGIRAFYPANAISQITRNGVVQGENGATWPSQSYSAGGTAYWGYICDFNVSIGTVGGTMNRLNNRVVEDMSKV